MESRPWSEIEAERLDAVEDWEKEIQRGASFFDTTQERYAPEDVKGPSPED